ncbi:MAG TPA: hypothetical protein VF857_04015, partial [Spirochaetota bacterium]
EQVGSLISFIGKTRAYAEQKKKNRNRDREEFFDDGRVDYMREQRERLKRLNGYDHDTER